jgi:hypothetical protein
MSSCNYIPIPARVWSRVQNPCTYIEPGSTYNQSFIPLTGQIVSQAQADYDMKMMYKGNILQHKGNSGRLTKSQKYSQLARMAGPNRTKVFATQSQTYTNPNTTQLLRVGFSTFSFPNQIVAAPNNISGPFSYGIPNPDGCSGNSIQDGGTLVCGTYANPCSGEIYKQGPTTSIVCNPSSASDVPGTSILCWNNNIQTWFPKPRYTMNNSTDKWPINYKGFLSAIHPDKPNPPILYFNFQEKIDKNFDNNLFNIKNLEDTEFYTEDFGNKELYSESIGSHEIQSINTHENYNYEIESNYTETNYTETNYTETNYTESIDTESIATYNFKSIITQNINTTEYHINFSWKHNYNFKADSFNIYINNKLYKTIKNDNKNNNTHKYKHRFNNSNNSNKAKQFNNSELSISMTAVLNNVESDMSNYYYFREDIIQPPPTPPPTPPPNDCCCDLTNVNNLLTIIDQKIDTKSIILMDRLDTIYNSITNVSNITTSIFDKVSLFKNCCDCSSNCTDFKCNCNFYNTLFSSSVITQINNYVSTYIETIYEDSDINIPIDVFDELNMQLVELEDLFITDPSCCFFNIIDIYRNMLKLVKSAYDNKNLAKATLINSESWRNDSIILNDREKLQEYINNLSKSFYITSIDVTSTYANLKPQYQIYMQLYGLPENLEFDPYKLSDIIKAIEKYNILYGTTTNNQYDVNNILKIINSFSEC